MALNIVAALDEELEALERRTKMIQDIKRLAADPEAKALLEKIALNGSTMEPPPSADPRESMHEEHSALSQIGSIRRVISKKHGQRFVVGDIGDELRASGMDVTNVAIGRVLLRLHKNGELRIALEGGGNVPNQYEATDVFSVV